MDDDSSPPPSSAQGSLEFAEETTTQKFRRRLREEPLIPLGCAATSYALYRAYKSMRARDSAEMNRMFRARIYAQFFTLVAVVAGGMYYKNERQQRREFERMLDERKNQEKRDAWLRELEVREREDRDWRERHAAVGQAARGVGSSNDNNGTTTSEWKISRPGSSPAAAEEAKVQDNTARAPIEIADEKGRSSAGVMVDAVRTLVWGR